MPADDSIAVDLAGLVSVPGLVDSHAHLSADQLELEPAEAAQVLRRGAAAVDDGVTVAVDKGWADDLVLEMVGDGRLVRPRVVAAGRMLRPIDGYWEDFGEVVDGAELVDVVGRLAENRPWVKVVGDWPRKGKGALPNYTEAVLTDAVAAAHQAGARVAIHTMAPEVPAMAVRAGVDSIEHGLFLSPADLELMAAAGQQWVPTVLRMEEVLDEMKPGSSGAELVGRGLDNVSRLLPVAADLGVAVLAGTDLAASVGQVGREVEALIRRGLPAHAALAGATEQAYRALPFEVGFRPGAAADLVAYAANPVDTPGVLTDPVVVVFDGEVVRDRR